MRHQHRDLGAGQHFAGRTAQDHLAQPAMAIGAHDQKIAVELLGLLQQGLLARDPADAIDGPAILIGDPIVDPRPQGRVLDQVGVEPRNRHVGLGQDHLHVVDHRGPERPVVVHLLECRERGGARR